jgi:hypothetical protein
MISCLRFLGWNFSSWGTFQWASWISYAWVWIHLLVKISLDWHLQSFDSFCSFYFSKSKQNSIKSTICSLLLKQPNISEKVGYEWRTEDFVVKRIWKCRKGQEVLVTTGFPVSLRKLDLHLKRSSHPLNTNRP